MDENNAAELDAGDDKGGKYKVEAICNSAVYAKESESGHFLGLYYLISWKGYLKEENTWEPYLAVQYPRKLIRLFYKDHFDKSTVIFEAIDTVLPMAKPTVKPTKQKQGQPANSSNKWAKKNWAAFSFCYILGLFTRCG